jgi:hypothetical protein
MGRFPGPATRLSTRLFPAGPRLSPQQLLSISRSSFYYTPGGESPENLALMRRIDELILKYPFYGSRQMACQLRREGAPQRDADAARGRREPRRRLDAWRADLLQQADCAPVSRPGVGMWSNRGARSTSHRRRSTRRSLETWG